MFLRHKNLRFRWLVVLVSITLLVACVIAIIIPAWWELRLKRSFAEWQRTHSDKAAQKVIQLLETHRYGALGNKALEEIISPTLRLRGNYLAGRRVFASLESDSMINPRYLLCQYLTEVLVGHQVVHQYEAQASLKKGGIANFQFTNGLRSNAIVPLNEPGDYQVVVILHIKLLARPRVKWKWPSSRSMPWKLLPERTGGPTGKPLKVVPEYECRFVLPAEIRIVPREKLDPVELVCSPELDRRVREAFRVQADSSRKVFYVKGQKESLGIPVRDPFSINYDNLPANIAFRMTFREVNGRAHRGSRLGSVKEAGESGVITPFEVYYDVLRSLPPGPYEGELVLESDNDAAYEFPGVTSLWCGTLSFPVRFFIDPL